MGCRGRPVFDLNEPPTEEDEEREGVICLQPQKVIPSPSLHTSGLFLSSEGCPRIVNNHAFSHAPSVSGFQPFVRVKDVLKENARKNAVDLNSNCATSAMAVDANYENQSLKLVSPGTTDDFNSNCASSSMAVDNNKENQVIKSVSPGITEARSVEREEGEWSELEGDADASRMDKNGRHGGAITDHGESVPKQGGDEKTDHCGLDKVSQDITCDNGPVVSAKGPVVNSMKEENEQASLGLEPEQFEHSHSSSRNSDGNNKGNLSADGLEESSSILKQKDIKGVEAIHASKCANNPGKRQKLDQHKEAMLGKKRSRQTVFLNLEDVKQAGPIKASTTRRQTFLSPTITRMVKEIPNVPVPAEGKPKDHKQTDAANTEISTTSEVNYRKEEPNGEINSGLQARTKKLNGGNDNVGEVYLNSIPRQGSWKQLPDSRQLKNQQVSTTKSAVQSRESLDTKLGNKKNPTLKKQPSKNLQYQDTSVERLIREVTNEKFWHHPGETDLQCVPGSFESVEEYVRVFEPLLFEECRAQLYSTWEESIETVSRDAHVMVRIKNVERRERE